MKSKESTFELKIGDIKTQEYPIMYHVNGDFSVLFQITNTIDRTTSTGEQYSEYKSTFHSIITTIGEGYTFQKQDILSKTSNGKKTKKDLDVLKTYLIITKNELSKSFFTYKQKEFDSFVEKIKLIEELLHSANLSPRVLEKQEIELLIKQYLTQDFSSNPKHLSTISIDEQKIHYTDSFLKIKSLVDVDETTFPNTTKLLDISNIKLSEQQDILSFLRYTPEVTNLVYNQVIRIPNQKTSIRKLKAKKNRYSNIVDPSNQLAIDEIEHALRTIETSDDLTVLSHFDILLKGNEQQIKEAEKHLEPHLHKIGVIPSDNAFNQDSLFTKSFPGNTNELNIDFEFFESFAKPSICLMYKDAI